MTSFYTLTEAKWMHMHSKCSVAKALFSVALEFLLQKFVFKGPGVFPARFHESLPETCAWTAPKNNNGGKKNPCGFFVAEERNQSWGMHTLAQLWTLSSNNFCNHKKKKSLSQFFCSSCCPDDTPEYKLQMKRSSYNRCILVTLEGRLFWDIMWKCFVISTRFIYMKEIIFWMFKKLQLSWEPLPFIV